MTSTRWIIQSLARLRQVNKIQDALTRCQNRTRIRRHPVKMTLLLDHRHIVISTMCTRLAVASIISHVWIHALLSRRWLWVQRRANRWTTHRHLSPLRRAVRRACINSAWSTGLRRSSRAVHRKNPHVLENLTQSICHLLLDVPPPKSIKNLSVHQVLKLQPWNRFKQTPTETRARIVTSTSKITVTTNSFWFKLSDLCENQIYYIYVRKYQQPVFLSVLR